MTGGYTYVIDSKGNYAKIRHFRGGLADISAGGAGQIQITNAETIDNLTGDSVSVGGSIRTPLVRLATTGEWIIMPGGYQGVNIGASYSIGPLPFETHMMLENSDIVYRGNIFRDINKIKENLIDIWRKVFG